MKRWLPILLTSFGLLVGCRSDCARLCDKQATCQGSPSEKGALSVEKRSELCRTVCEAMLQDPEKKTALLRASECIGKPCGEFSKCVEAAGAVK